MLSTRLIFPTVYGCTVKCFYGELFEAILKEVFEVVFGKIPVEIPGKTFDGKVE